MKVGDEMKTYKIKANIGDTVDELGPFVDDETRWTMEDVKGDAMNYEMTVEEFIERYLEEVK